MLTDSDTNTAYLAWSLRRYHKVYDSLVQLFLSNGIKVENIYETNNIWVRDYMPIQVSDNHFVEFMYGADTDKYPQLKLPWEVAKFPFMKHLTLSGVYLDGGNCVRYGDRAIITDIVFRDNTDIEVSKKDVLKALEDNLEAEVIIIPKVPYEITGHSDGMVRWINDKTVFVNDDPNNRFVEKLINTLTNKYNLNCVLFPCAYNDIAVMKRNDFYKTYPDADTYQPSQGWYINYLMINKLIIVGKYGVDKDKEAKSILEQYFPECNIVDIDCRDIGNLGGGVHCITWNIKVDEYVSI